jgi:hypothetical protein
MYEAFPDQVSVWHNHIQPAFARQTRNEVNSNSGAEFLEGFRTSFGFELMFDSAVHHYGRQLAKLGYLWLQQDALGQELDEGRVTQPPSRPSDPPTGFILER